MTYNPADYNAVLSNAKEMSKEKLEKAYTDDKSKRHLSCVDIIGIVILICGFIFVIGYCGYIIGEEVIMDDVSEKITIVEDEICPMINESYKSPALFDSRYRTTKIDCS